MHRIFFIFLTVLPFFSFSQSITTSDLILVLNKSGWYDVDSYLQNKNWNYYRSENTIFGSIVTWSLEMDYDKKALGWIKVNLNESKPEFVSYKFYNEVSYKKCVADFTKFGFTTGIDKVADGALIQIYFSDKYTLLVTKESNIDDDLDYTEGPNTTYNIAITKKGSSYDPYNGHIVTYYDDSEQIKEDYYLVRGKIHGPYKRYFENGDLAEYLNYKNDVLEGKGVLYDDYNHEYRRELFYINGKAEGKRNHYMGDSLIQSYTIKSDSLNGPFYVWLETEDGKIQKHVGTYLNGDLNGKLLISELNSGKLIPIKRITYLKDVRQGILEKYKGDTLTIENYNQDLLDGICLVYLKKPKQLNDFDTARCTLLEKFSYSDDLRQGEFFKFDTDGNLTISGYFDQDEISGNWKFYNHEFIDSIADGLTSSASFLNGELNGKKVTYVSAKYDPLDCDDPLVNYVENDSCYHFSQFKEKTIYTYKNGTLDGEFAKYDKNGKLLRKGNYKDGKRLGEWVFIDLDEENSPIKTKVTYRNGLVEGKVIALQGSDTISIREYKLDKLNGEWISFENGRRAVIRQFNYGTLVSEKILYPLNCSLEEYELTEFTPNHIKINARYCLNDTIFYTQFLINYNFDQQTLEANYLRDIIDISFVKENILIEGKQTKKNENGQLLETAIYKQNRLNGTRKKYDYKNHIVICDQFQTGQLLSASFEFLNGDPYSGTYTYYDSEMNRSYKIQISKGQKKKETIYFGNFEKKLDVIKY